MQCPICLGNPTEPLTLDCCNNVYCKACIHKWSEVKNTCPLCCRRTSEQEVNSLKIVPVTEQNFDDGFLMLQTQIKQITPRIGHLSTRINTRRQQSQKLKSAISASFVQYLLDEMQKIKLYESLMHEQFLLLNRAKTVQYLQIIAETVLNCEKSLQNNSIEGDYEQLDYDYDYEDEAYMDELADEYEEYEYYEEIAQKKSNFKSKKSKGGGSSSPTINAAENKNKAANLK